MAIPPTSVISTHPAGVDDHYLWGSISISTEEAIGAAIALRNAAYRKYKIESMAELSPKRRQNCKDAILRSFNAAGIREIVQEWWDNYDES